jgi:uncharacterized surface protein with fasciclin (FAS1) repeats
MTKTKPLAALVALAMLAPLGACSKSTTAEGKPSNADTTLASAIGDAPKLSTVSSALSQAGLAGVFDGPGSYTVLAPEDAAFAKLGTEEKTLTDPAHRAELVALLRGHILPGHVSPDAIKKAIAAKKGPVSMRTLADGEVTFSESGGKLFVTGADGSKAQVDGAPIVASNGVVLPLDGLVKKPLPAPAG